MAAVKDKDMIASLVAQGVDEGFKVIVPAIKAQFDKSQSVLVGRIRNVEDRQALNAEGRARDFDAILQKLQKEILAQYQLSEESIKELANSIALVRDAALAEVRAGMEELAAVRLSVEQTMAAIKALPAPRNGKDGENGKDGKFPPPVQWEANKLYGHSTIALHKGGMFFAERSTEQEPGSPNSGWSLMLDGVKDIELVWDKDHDFRKFLMYTLRTSGAIENFEIRLPFPIYQGTWKEGHYEQQDLVTRNGSVWICLNDTDTTPGTAEGVDDWQLAVKAGAPGKKGKAGENGEDGKAGKDGVSVKDISMDDDHNFIIELDDGKKFNLGTLRGEKGEDGVGKQGARGPRGPAGDHIVGVSVDKKSKDIVFERKEGTDLKLNFAEVFGAFNDSPRWAGAYEAGKTYAPGEIVRIGPSQVVICLQATDTMPPIYAEKYETDKNWDIFMWVEAS
jgi:hypothetical protein